MGLKDANTDVLQLTNMNGQIQRHQVVVDLVQNCLLYNIYIMNIKLIITYGHLQTIIMTLPDTQDADLHFTDILKLTL